MEGDLLDLYSSFLNNVYPRYHNKQQLTTNTCNWTVRPLHHLDKLRKGHLKALTLIQLVLLRIRLEGCKRALLPFLLFAEVLEVSSFSDMKTSRVCTLELRTPSSHKMVEKNNQNVHLSIHYFAHRPSIAVNAQMKNEHTSTTVLSVVDCIIDQKLTSRPFSLPI